VKTSLLADHLMISNPGVSQMLNVLETKGYVERSTNKNDRRVVYVKLTEYGRELLGKELGSITEILSNIFDKMGEEDVFKLIELINKFYVIAKEYVKK
jgi:DNA-binding MarR family transcriptional regulator